MSTLLVLHLGSRGGGPRMLHDFARAAASDGRTEVALAYYGGCEVADDLHALGRAEHVAPAARRAGRLGVLERVVSSLGYAVSLPRFARRHDVSAAYSVMDSPLEVLPILLLRLAGIPVLGSVHDADRHPGEENPFMEVLMRARPHISTGLLTYSSTVAALMRDRVRRPERVFETVHGAYGSTGAAPVPRAGVSVPTVVGFFGRLLPYKGIDRLADAIAVLQREGRRVELRVHGRGDIEADLTAQLERVSATVDNTWVDDADVADLVASFDVVALPYSEASQSGIVGFAMHAGVPIVTTPLPGLVEQVVVPGVGIAAADLSAEAFASAIGRLMDDRSLYASLSARGPIEARTSFGWPRVVTDVLEACEALRTWSPRRSARLLGQRRRGGGQA